MITATKPFSPPLEEYQSKIAEIFSNNWFTNHGPMVTELEQKLKDYFDVPYLVIVSNGTIALQIAIKALDLRDEVITTPFSYVATTSSIFWENCTPRFADINPITLNIEPSAIRNLISDRTSGIIATNVYGYPCDFESINKLSKEFNIPVIYDNAHGFSSKYKGKDLLNQGNISTISFHATKLFHSVEGGAIVCQDEKTYKKLLSLRNFGHTSPYTFDGVGINGKMNELCGAMGLVNLNHLDEILAKRKKQWNYYFKELSNTSLDTMSYNYDEVEFNHAYFPVIFDKEVKLIETMAALERKNVFTRRYFSPSLNMLGYLTIKDSCPISEDISSRIICLPLYHDLSIEDQDLILNTIKKTC